ncbi:MAG: hypothetical protein JZD40_05915, partial [Sulfolobus sp.]|nr:hypothetical protein [Sulfolobus sp.]
MVEREKENTIEMKGVIYHKERGQLELKEVYPNEKYLWNADVHPTPISLRNWGPITYLMVWVSMVFIVPSWTL